jgi:hypothetical protein
VTDSTIPVSAYDTFLSSKQLALRWDLADNTLRKWRVDGIGPQYIKLGFGRCSGIRYRLADVLAYEQQGMVPTSRPKKGDA